MNREKYQEERDEMVRSQLETRGITSSQVLDLFRRIPRHLFVPPHLSDIAYEDRPLTLGPDQTISQPYIVALMLQELEVEPQHAVLDVGTGSGYLTALLAELSRRVVTIEIDSALLQKSRILLDSLGYQNITYIAGDGAQGAPQHAPFDRIIVSALCEEIPRPLIQQLSPEGRMVLPVKVDDEQILVLLSKTPDGLTSKELGAVRFVPLKPLP